MKEKIVKRCSNCGFEVIGNTNIIKCPECGEIGSFVDVVENEKENAKISTEVKKLVDVKKDNEERIFCGISEVDRVFGGGFVRDSVNIITAPPGQGKSTLILDIANKFALQNKTVLYVSSEESETQVKNRANRILKDDLSSNLYILSSKETMDLEPAVKIVKPDVLIVDSISSFRSGQFNSPAGSIIQVREASDRIISLCKHGTKPTIGIVVVHMTKDDELAGSRSIEHDVDAVMYLEGSTDDDLRILRSTKNRFGELDTGLFTMSESGLKEIKDPSTFFVTKRETNVQGSALSVIKEGNRAIVVEIESLLTPSFTTFPTRIATCLRKDNLNILISIIEKYTEIDLSKFSAILNTTNHIKISNTACDLAICMSILSSYFNKPLENEIVFLAEIGLTGELKKVSGIEKRIKELDRLGYKKVFISERENIPQDKYKIEIIKKDNLANCVATIFGIPQ